MANISLPPLHTYACSVVLALRSGRSPRAERIYAVVMCALICSPRRERRRFDGERPPKRRQTGRYLSLLRNAQWPTIRISIRWIGHWAADGKCFEEKYVVVVVTGEGDATRY